MDTKNSFYRALKRNSGHLNESDLGEMIGITGDELNKIIDQLLSEYKIEYHENRACNYRPIKRNRK